MTESTSNARAYIVIVNWNGWRDTIECLESVFRIIQDNFSVIVCDNDSKDGSIERIVEWAKGNLAAVPALDQMKSWSAPPVTKPVPFVLLEVSQLEDPQACSGEARLILIRSRKNLGFAGGNNLGLRYILRRNDHEYVWLLNNDTVVHPKSLACLIDRMKEDMRIGICGSKLCFYSVPHLVQAYGGSAYSPLTGRNRHIGISNPASVQEDRASVERQLGYILGASMLISRDFLDHVGLMNEDYFLYYEEIDWVTRAKGKFLQGYAPGSIVFHKHGSSLGGNWPTRGNASEESFTISDFYSVRNQIRFTRRYHPHYLPVVAITISIRLLKRIVAGKTKRVRSVLRGVASAFTGKPVDPPVDLAGSLTEGKI